MVEAGWSQSALTHSFHSWLLPPETSPGLGDENTKIMPLRLWQGEGKIKLFNTSRAFSIIKTNIQGETALPEPYLT